MQYSNALMWVFSEGRPRSFIENSLQTASLFSRLKIEVLLGFKWQSENPQVIPVTFHINLITKESVPPVSL